MNKTETILIVDDNRENRALLETILKGNTRFNIEIATNGQEALDKIEHLDDKSLPRLILMDVMMPKIDGFTAAKKIKDCHRTTNIPIIFITALTSVENIVKAFKYGGVDYITKPFRKEEIISRVTTHIKLKRLIDNLGEEVKLKTKELQKAYDDLKSVDEMKDSFISLISHEFNTPLSIINGFAENLLQLTDIDKDMHDQCLIEIRNAGERLHAMVEDLKLISMLEANIKFYSVELCDVKEIINDVITELNEITKNKKIAIHFHCNFDELYLINISKHLLTKAIYNIIHNSVKNTHKNGKISIHLKKDDIHCTVIIADTGTGISKDLQKDLFEKFRHVESVSHHSEGLGLGLPITKKIIEIFDGIIRLESEEEKGTIITLTFQLFKKEK